MVTGLMAPGTHKYSDTKAILENMGKLSDNQSSAALYSQSR